MFLVCSSTVCHTSEAGPGHGTPSTGDIKVQLNVRLKTPAPLCSAARAARKAAPAAFVPGAGTNLAKPHCVGAGADEPDNPGPQRGVALFNRTPPRIQGVPESGTIRISD